MHEDPKLAFYLQRREQIEDWAALRTAAAEALDRVLEAAVADFLLDPEHGDATLRKDWAGTHVFMPAGDPDQLVGIGLWWKKSDLFKPTALGCWPVLAITALNGRANPYRRVVKEATSVARLRYQMERSEVDWIWHRRFCLDPGATDLDQLAADCFTSFHDAWLGLGPTIREAVDAKPAEAN